MVVPPVGALVAEIPVPPPRPGDPPGVPGPKDPELPSEPDPAPLPDPLPDPEPVPSPIATMQRVPIGAWPGEVRRPGA